MFCLWETQGLITVNIIVWEGRLQSWLDLGGRELTKDGFKIVMGALGCGR